MSFFGKLFATVPSVGNHVAAGILSGSPDPFERLEWLGSVEARLDALARASRTLSFDEEYDGADRVLEHAATLQPLALIERRIDLARMRQEPEKELALVRLGSASRPADPDWRARLAELLLEFERADEALAVLDAAPGADKVLDTTRAMVLVELGQLDAARALAHELMIYWDEAARGSLMEVGMTSASHFHSQAAAVIERIAAIEGGESGMVLAVAATGRLDKNAPGNYATIGRALMERGHGASEAPLALPDDDAAHDALRGAPDDPSALCMAGLVALRLGDAETAARRFRRAHDVDAAFFPAPLGLAAALRMQQTNGWRPLERLEPVSDSAAIERLVPQWPALTDVERRVVQASVRPVRALLDALVGSGARIEILAQGQIASPTPSPTRFVPIEELLDTTSEAGWVLAREVAELASRELSPPDAERLHALHLRAEGQEWAVGMWAQLDPAALFAAGCEAWLRRRHGRKHAPTRDSEGLVQALEALVDAISAAE